jgi:hypothetical protein
VPPLLARQIAEILADLLRVNFLLAKALASNTIELWKIASTYLGHCAMQENSFASLFKAT